MPTSSRSSTNVPVAVSEVDGRGAIRVGVVMWALGMGEGGAYLLKVPRRVCVEAGGEGKQGGSAEDWQRSSTELQSRLTRVLQLLKDRIENP